MKFSTITGVLFLSLLLPFSLQAQSLGSVAKKERDRREKNKKEGVAVREFSEDQVFGKEEEEALEEAEAQEAGEGSVRSERADSPVDETARSDQESRERRRSEAEWRARASQAKARIASARERIQMLEGLFLPQGGRYVDVHGNTVIESLEHLQSLVREAKEELAEAEKAQADLQNEARRAGIPPGWIR